ncbi:MAG: acylneuraminate cytidylyltransferase family protein [Chloroflexi bacterium]|nr:MAG: acylneuraminate cytidylyltransferase family protein [Chloroflexota bacterium]MBL1194294.1 acylneuraminate cytidylyltransferase family protein [Chloroflexota bacterium]NOH11584.1 acylneuraminate cytidylyltransferase family protein [Chloroflexota bacterium]
MTNNTEVLALIPARGGSKSIPRKNVHAFDGHPLIAYSIASALAAETVTRVIVSTDNEEIAEVSKRYGAEVPFTRPDEHAQDETPDLPVFQHALEWLAENEDYKPDIVVQLRPTSPLRRLEHIDNAVLRLAERRDVDAVRTVCVPFQNPFKMWTIGQDGVMQPLMQTEFKEPYNMPRQALPDVYWQTGYVDAVWADTILNKDSMTGDRILPLVIDASDWIDIDAPDDWRRAERFLESGEITMEELGYQVTEKA